MQGHLVEAIIRYLTAEEGGRQTPVASGYRGQFHYEDDPETVHDGFQLFPDLAPRAFVSLGVTVRALIWFPQDRWDGYHRERITVGTRFQIREGRRLVGWGEVTRVEVEEAP